MAFIPAQLGATTDRIRRFFGVRGPYSASVDETASPVVVLADLASQPYDVNSQRFACTRREIATGVEARYRTGIINDSNTLLVVDRVQVASNRNFSVLIGSEVATGFGRTGSGHSRDLTTLNVGGFETGSFQTPRPVPVPTFFNIAAVADLATTCWQGDAATSYDIPVGWVLAPGMTLYFALAAPIAAGDQVSFNLWGRLFNDPSLTVAP